jgi:hypothetical protein
MIPKKNGKLRPLGLPGWSDKLVGEVMRLLLEAYYEPQFSDRSHRFRPKRGCHTALREVANTWTGTTWLIESDISDCFGSLDHEVMMSILSEKIHDNRFLQLRVEHLPVELIAWQAAPAAFTEDTQHCFGALQFRIPLKRLSVPSPGPFALIPAFPDFMTGRYPGGYYEASVTIGLASLR